MSRNRDAARGAAGRSASNSSSTPVLMTVPEVADLLRTTDKAIYAMVDRNQLPGVTRIGRRVLIRASELVHWLNQTRTLSPEEIRR